MVPESLWHLLFVATMGAFLIATVAYLIFKCVTRRLKRLQILPIAMIPNSNAGVADRPDDNQPENLAADSPNGNNRVFYILVVPGSDPSGAAANGAAAGGPDAGPQAITASDGSIYAHYSGWHYKKTRPPSYDAVMRQNATLGLNGGASSRRQSQATAAASAAQGSIEPPAGADDAVDPGRDNGAYQSDESGSPPPPVTGRVDPPPDTIDQSLEPPPSYDRAVRRNSRRKSMFSSKSNV